MIIHFYFEENLLVSREIPVIPRVGELIIIVASTYKVISVQYVMPDRYTTFSIQVIVEYYS